MLVTPLLNYDWILQKPTLKLEWLKIDRILLKFKKNPKEWVHFEEAFIKTYGYLILSRLFILSLVAYLNTRQLKIMSMSFKTYVWKLLLSHECW